MHTNMSQSASPPATPTQAHGHPDSPSAAPGLSAYGFAAISKFVVANGMTEQVKSAFRARPHMVDTAPGFQRMDVLSPMARPEEIWLLTFWTDEASFRAWHKSHQYHDAHKGIPKGLKLVPGETKITHYQHVAS